ncbi:MAG: AEC family transporter [Defluviitaleaceae bacterium]|nr:AEC family transporter [Defluviitaleaceae bacterium]
MLDNFLFSLNVVVPVFVVMFLGYALKKRDIITSGFLASGNKIVYYIGLPALLFRGVYSTEIGAFMDARFIIFTLSGSVAAFFIIWGVSAIFLKEKAVLASFAQGAYRGSFALLGTPLILNLAGAEGMARAALVVVFVVPFFNVFSIMALAPCTEEKVGPLKVIWAVIKNPSNIMIAIGIVLAVFELPLPIMIEGAINTTANLATPLALLCLGGGMVFHGFDAKFKYAMIGSVIKVAVMPFIMIILAVALGFRDYDLAVIVMLFGVPSAVVGYAMAAQMGGDTYVAGTIVVFSTIMSAVTLTAFIYVLRVMGMLAI